MKQIWPNYSYSPTTNVLTLTGLNIDRDQLLLVTAADRGRIMYNFADSSVTASAFTAGANTGLTLVASTAGLTTTAALVIYYDDQVAGISGTVDVDLVTLVGTVNNVSNVSAVGSLPAITGTVTVGNFPASQSVTFGAVTGSVSVLNFPASQSVTFTDASLTNTQLRANAVTIGGTVTASISGTIPISIASVTVGNSITISSLPSLIAGTAQIGSVTASISGTVPISISSVTIGNSVTIAALPAISGTVTVGNSVTIGSLPAISGTVTANLSISATAITSGSFASLTSATLVPGNVARKMATVYNLGVGQLFVNAGATATTLGGGFMVALSSGDFYECDYTTTTLSAIFATAGTASWVSH